MRTFIQLRDGIGYATLITPSDAPDHSVTPDHTNAIEVFTDNPDQFLKQIYNAETKSWSPAPILRYAEINVNGEIIEVKRTVFPHEIDHDTKLMEDDTTHLHKWVDGAWVAPLVIEPNPTIVQPTVVEVIPQVAPLIPETDTEKEQRLARESL